MEKREVAANIHRKIDVRLKRPTVRYEVKYNNNCLHTDRYFKTFEEALQYKQICDNYINSVRLKNLAKVDINDVSWDYPTNLLKDLEIGDEKYVNFYSEILPNFEKNFELAKTLLTDREYCFLIRYYRDAMTYETIGKLEGITRERVRQIIGKGLRKIKFSEVRDNLIKGKSNCELISYEERKQMYEEIKSQMTKEIACEILGIDINEIDTKKESFPIEKLNLSVRSYNGLKRAGINTTDDLSTLTNQELSEIKNLGSKSVREILTKLTENKIRLKEI